MFKGDIMSEQNTTQAVPVEQSTEVVDNTTQTQEDNSAEQAALASVDSAETKPAIEAVKEAEKALKRKIKLKIDGEESEEEIDLSNDDELRKHLQMSKVAQKRMSEKAQLEKEIREFVDLLKKDPRRVLTDPSIGVDLKQLAASIIEEEINQAKKSPEQIEKEKIEAELKALK